MFHQLAVEVISVGKRQFEDDRLVLRQLVQLCAQGCSELVFYCQAPGFVEGDLLVDQAAWA